MQIQKDKKKRNKLIKNEEQKAAYAYKYLPTKATRFVFFM